MDGTHLQRIEKRRMSTSCENTPDQADPEQTQNFHSKHLGLNPRQISRVKRNRRKITPLFLQRRRNVVPKLQKQRLQTLKNR